VTTNGGSIIFKPVNTANAIRCEVCFGRQGDDLFVRLYYPHYRRARPQHVHRNEYMWQHIGAATMETVEYIQWVLCTTFSMSPDDIARVTFRGEK
jgi:hypothetical protein